MDFVGFRLTQLNLLFYESLYGIGIRALAMSQARFDINDATASISVTCATQGWKYFQHTHLSFLI